MKIVVYGTECLRAALSVIQRAHVQATLSACSIASRTHYDV